MAIYHTYRVWKLSMELLKEVQTDLALLKGERDLKDQSKRSSRSIMANICEGSERRSDKEKRQFFTIARASAAELQSWYELLHAIGVIDHKRFACLQDKIDHIGRGLSRFIARLSGGT